MAWVDALDWQKRALRAERQVQDISGRLAELEAQVAEAARRDKCLHALEAKVGRLEGALRRVEQGAATKSAVDGVQVSRARVARMGCSFCR